MIASADRPYDPNARRDTPLGRQLAARIRETGPISVAEYMRTCLHDRAYGYYKVQTAIGANADFITAPEISQVFGELVGLWGAIVWRLIGQPSRLSLLEIGAGRGTMMRDTLRAARTVPGYRDAIIPRIQEPSLRLRELQRATLGQSGDTVRFIETADDLDPAPTIAIANEVIDCVAINQRVWAKLADGTLGWRERVVGLDETGALAFALGAPVGGISEPYPVTGSAPRPILGDIIEERQVGCLLDSLTRIAEHGSVAALFFDYGHEATGYGDTLQAVRGHALEHPLTSPGEADLTSQVDFAATARQATACGFCVDGPATQAEFLGRLGATERASALMAANPARASEIESGVLRLMAPNGMGTRFKAMALRSADVAPLPGFETA
ncbi:MAG: SAM-dependent methyltransferase [Pseudomonadota bacterium]